jgi:uncharacterized membrane protein YraQ (UPF0718 family)
MWNALADALIWQVWGLPQDQAWAHALHFWIADTLQILALLAGMIYGISFLRAQWDSGRMRNFLRDRSRAFAYVAAAGLGAVTPFCSCSSIPLFLGFVAAGIPVGVTLAFLITSPLINEVAVVLLGAKLGLDFTLIYVISGITIGVLGGWFFDALGAQKWLRGSALALVQRGASTGNQVAEMEMPTLQTRWNLAMRHQFAWSEMLGILKRLWLWVFLGVGLGALIHGYLPQAWIVEHLGGAQWWSVPLAVLIGIPLYANATGMVPILEVLIQKGLPIGTALALMLATVGASLPEFMLLRQVLHWPLLLWLLGYFLVSFSVMGWLMNALF